MSDTTLATRPESVKDFLALPSYKERFAEVLKGRAPQFMASIVAVSQLPGLRDCEPRSIIGAAMTAATLDLAVNPTLGQAYVVAYNDGQNGKVAQFQIGYKGLIQLALRSGQYKRLNAGPVSDGAFKGFDLVGEPILDFTMMDPDAEVVGYFCAFETLNGFQKITYWTRKQVERHATRFSKAFQKGWSGPWKSDFDAMATKTVIKAALTKWGIMSIELQKAAVHDQGVQTDVDADVKFVDQPDPAEESDKPLEAAPGATKGAAGAVNNAKNVTPPPAPDPLPADATPAETPAPESERAPSRPRRGAAPKPEVPAQPAEAPASAATPPKPVEKPSEPLPPGAAPKPDSPRVFLQDGERITAEVEVTELITGNSKVGKELVPTVQADVRGDFNGAVRHSGGATLNAAGVAIETPPWAKGAKVRLELLGKKSTSTTGPNVGKVLVWVQKIEAITGAQGQIPVEEA